MQELILGTGLSFDKRYVSAETIISEALDNGIRKFDTAPSYGTESMLGEILEKSCKKKNININNVYIQTKIDAWQMQEGKIESYIDNALRNLKVDYLDAILIHWPIPEYMDRTWNALKKAYQCGKVKEIGICNIRKRHLQTYLSLRPDIIQIERHPLYTSKDEVDFCHKNNLKIQAYSPLCKMDNRIKDNETIKIMCRKYKKNEGQIILRWHLENGVIPIFTTTKTHRIVSYTSIYDFQLTREEIELIDQMNQNYKLYLESVACPGF